MQASYGGNKKSWIYSGLLSVFSEVKNRKELEHLVKAVLTENEVRMIHNRFHIARMLSEDASHDEINKQLHVGMATISRIRGSMNRQKDDWVAVVEILKRLEKKLKKLAKEPTYRRAKGFTHILEYYED